MNFGKLVNYEINGQTVALEFAEEKAEIQVITSEIFRVFCGFEDDGTFSNAIEGDKKVETSVEVCRTDAGIWIKSASVHCLVSDNFMVDFFDTKGEPICLDYRGQRKKIQRMSEEVKQMLISEGHMFWDDDSDHKIQIIKKMLGTECFYGLGDKTGFLNKRGYEYINWNTDNPDPHVDAFKMLYKTIPFFMTATETHTYGIFFDNTYKSFFDMGKETQECFWFGADDGNLDYYFIYGDHLKDVLSKYTYLTGTCPLPQKWTLGYQQSRWGYVDWRDVSDIAHRMRENRIPCDVIHLDLDYMDNFKVFTWNKENYEQDPAKCLQELKNMGIKVVTIIDPGVKQEAGYSVYEEGITKGYFAKDPEGNVYVNEVWPGKSVFPDFGCSEVRSWWGDNTRFLTDLGVGGIWNDMNEPASFNGPLPDDVVFSENDNPSKHKKVHNIYGHNMSKATYEGLMKNTGRRPFVITRACYAGTQKYSTAWTGDNQSLWAHLQMLVPQLCNLGLSGMPFVGTDIGGFGADTTPELLTRWIQAGIFSPLCRNHAGGGTRPQEPWVFGEEILDIYRKYVELRYHLIPYIYDLFFEEEKTGMPLMRPLILEYPKDPVVREMNDEFMLGSQILVAPVLMQGMKARAVYLPEGSWYDYWTKGKIEGNRWIMRETPLDTCPIYVKAGTMLPTYAPQQYVGEKECSELIVEVYPGEGIYDHYLDNGEDFAYRAGEYIQYHFVQEASGIVAQSIVHDGYGKPYQNIIFKNIMDIQTGE